MALSYILLESGDRLLMEDGGALTTEDSAGVLSDSIVLPTAPLPQSATPHYLDFGGVQTPPGGGASQKLNRLGDRYAIDITTPRLKPEPDGRIWVQRLQRAMKRGAIYPFPQPGLIIGNPGSPVVDGAGQAGSLLALRGFAPGYTVREGQYFSIIHGGRRYLHSAAVQTTANGAGTMTLSITPMLRIAPADGATCEFAEPMIEGFLGGNEMAWTLVIARVQGLTFTITEAG
jgi:hypothetical protein